MKILLDSLHFNVHTRELYPKKLQPYEIKSKLDSWRKMVKCHLCDHPKLNHLFKDYFWTDSINCNECNSSCVLNGKESTDFIQNLFPTKFND